MVMTSRFAGTLACANDGDYCAGSCTAIFRQERKKTRDRLVGESCCESKDASCQSNETSPTISVPMRFACWRARESTQRSDCGCRAFCCSASNSAKVASAPTIGMAGGSGTATLPVADDLPMARRRIDRRLANLIQAALHMLDQFFPAEAGRGGLAGIPAALQMRVAVADASQARRLE